MDKRSHVRSEGGGRLGSRLKRRLAQILLRSSCTTATTNSATAFVGLPKNNTTTLQEPTTSPCPTNPRPKLDRRRLREAPFVHISIDCGGGGGSGRRSVHSDTPLLRNAPVRDEKKNKPCSTSKRYSKPSRAKESPKVPVSNPDGFCCSSSTVTDNELGPISSDDDDGDDDGEEEAETRTLFSSMSFSSDSSEFYNNTKSRKKSKFRRRQPRRIPRTAKRSSKAEKESDAFRPLVSVAAGEKKEDDEKAKAAKGTGAGHAVVKRSSNPYADFRSSMVEMIVDRRISSIDDLEQLLGSYLSLNSPRHHPAILAAFEDVWEAIFGED